MRKDVILGMSIGGVMLAVVIVYLTVTPSGKHKKQTVDTSGQVAEGSGGPADSTGADPAIAPADVKHPDKPDAVASPDGASADPLVLRAGPEDKSDPIWGDKLFGKSTPLIGTTRSPDPSAVANGNNGDSIGGGDQTPPPVAAPVNPGDAAPGFRTATPPAPSTQPSVAGRMHKHKITKGENFSTIAAAYYGSPNFYPHIQRANPTVDPTRLKPGIEINLPDVSEVKPPEKAPDKISDRTSPDARTASHHHEPTVDPKKEYVVQASDSLYRISMKLYGTADMVDKLYALNKSTIGEDRAKLKLWSILKLPSEPSAKEPVAKQ